MYKAPFSWQHLWVVCTTGALSPPGPQSWALLLPPKQTLPGKQKTNCSKAAVLSAQVTCRERADVPSWDDSHQETPVDILGEEAP